MMHIILNPAKKLFSPMITLFLFLFLFTACTSTGGNGQTPVATAHAHGTATLTPTPTPGIALGSQNCPATVRPLAYWDTIIPTQANVSKTASVTCGYLKGAPSLQALVTVLYAGTGSVLDVYVYDNLTSATPTKIFTLQNLYEGSAKISGYNSVLTAEVDQHSSVNTNQSGANFTQDLFREFKWSDGAGTLVQVTFPGIFPDLTRYQAESDQAQVNQGHQGWKLSATSTAQALGASLLHWDPNAPATTVSGGGARDTQAVVSLQNTGAGGSTIQLTMARLEGNANGGIWIVTAVEANGMSITSPQSANLLHSPVTVAGTGPAFEGVIGTVTVLDHLYTDIGDASAHGAAGNGATTFSTGVTYHPTFTTGAEEGLLLLTAQNNAGGPAAAAVIVKVLLQ